MTFTEHVLDIAGSQVGVREVGRNAGRDVEKYQAAVGLEPGDAWCAAFVSWCYKQAAEAAGMALCPMATGGGALRLWEHAPPWHRAQAPEPGAVFVIDHGGGKGHCGLVEHVDQGAPGDLVTIEGNTNDSGGREGDGVHRRIRKLPIPGLVGYIVPARSLGAVPEREA